MNPETSNIHPQKEWKETLVIPKKISNLLLAFSTLALAVIGGCSKNTSQDGSKHMKPSLHLSCNAMGNSLERRSQVYNISNVKLTQDMQGTNCTYYTEDMYKAGNQIPVTVSCKPKAKNKETISKKIDGVTIEVNQSNAICEITNK